MTKLLTPLRSIRKYCLWCCCDSFHEVSLCPAESCSLWPFRFGKGSKGKGGLLKPIRLKCLDCSAGQQSKVRNCWNKDCPLYPYRMGKRPKKPGAPKRKGSNKGIEAMQKANRESESP